MRQNPKTSFQNSLISHLLILTIYDAFELIRAISQAILEKYIVKGLSQSVYCINSVDFLKSSESQWAGWKKQIAIKIAVKPINKGNSLHSWEFRSFISNCIDKIQKS